MTAKQGYGPWGYTVEQVRQKLLRYRASEDAEAYAYQGQQIDVQLPLFKSATMATESEVHCYRAIAEQDEVGYSPCAGEFLVMSHPLMMAGFHTALAMCKVSQEMRHDKFKLPEERFKVIEGRWGYSDWLAKVMPSFARQAAEFRAISVIYGSYAPPVIGRGQIWVGETVPRWCFVMEVNNYDKPWDSPYLLGYSHAMLRFELAPSAVDRLRRKHDRLMFPERMGCTEVGYHPNGTAYYMIVQLPKFGELSSRN